MTKQALLTVTIGSDEISCHTVPRMERYAEACGAEFVRLTQSTMFRKPMFCYWEGLLRLVEEGYDRILKLDSDILVRNDAPSIFSVYPHADVAMRPAGYIRPPHHQRIRQQIAADFRVRDMFNAGVILINREVVLRLADQLVEVGKSAEKVRFQDQVFFCLLLKQARFHPRPLSWRWNQHDNIPVEVARRTHFLHFRGPKKKERLEDFLANCRSRKWSIRSVDQPAS